MPAERRSSNTALGVTKLRAVHQLLDGEPKVLNDPIAAQLLDVSTVFHIHTHPEYFQTPEMKALRAHIITRSRYAEDRLAAAMQRGIRQYMILGAGFDTFAYRQPAWAKGLQIFEVDHPASQYAKLDRLSEAGIAIPANLEFVAIDFEHVSLRDGLQVSGFDASQPTFVAWLGVMMYLSTEAIDAVLRFVVALPRSSEIVFTFATPDPVVEHENRGLPRLAEVAAIYGEPWRTRVEPEHLVQQFQEIGFSAIALLTPAEVEPYFRGRYDQLRAPRRVSIGSALV
ncbi:MAG: class I SAM-dependent methyltransferase [Chloroflexi bacterium]|nr:class I SAM-dependent methyltransferase [Chloroflexota bacterium]